jgi:hypothetical protein
LNGKDLLVVSATVLSGATLHASGSTLVASGGEAFDTIVDGGGLANFHGTTVSGTISGGGTLALLDNAAAGGTFAGGGILQVEVPQPFPALRHLGRRRDCEFLKLRSSLIADLPHKLRCSFGLLLRSHRWRREPRPQNGCQYGRMAIPSGE